MNECKVFFHPAFAEAVKDVAKLDEERTRLKQSWKTIHSSGYEELLKHNH